MEPWLNFATYQQQVRCLKVFAACILSGRYGQGKYVAIGTVSGVLSSVGTTVALVNEGNSTKAQGKKALVPLLEKMM